MATLSSPTLLGRRTELRRLDAAWRQAASGRPGLVLLAGEAGIGKSRLLRELASHVQLQGGRALLGTCLRLGDSPLPFVPMVGIVRRLARDPDPAAQSALAVARADLAALVPSLLGPPGSAGLGAEPAPVNRSGPAVRPRDANARSRLFEAFLGLVVRLSEDRPLLLGIEDVQWADAATRDLLTFLVAGLADEPLMLGLTLRTDGLARSDPVVGWLAELVRGRSSARIDLERLGVDEVREQVAAITGRVPDPGELEAIWQRSDGNPFFVEELLAAGVESPPRTLSEILLARVALLSAPARRAVRAIAVAGGPVDEGVLGRVLGLDTATLHELLREPIDAGLLRIDDAGRCRPRHALLGEVVEASLLAGERRELHEAVARALDALPPAQVGVAAVVATARARHWDAAGRPAEAYAAALDAAAAAEDLFAHAEALGHLRRALELDAAHHLSARPEGRLALLDRATGAAELAGDTEAVGAWSREAEALREARTAAEASQDAKANALVVRAGRPGLSSRELEVLRLVAAGRSNGQIADALYITRKTASSHVTHILDKLGVGNRLEAAMTAARLGLLDEPPGTRG